MMTQLGSRKRCRGSPVLRKEQLERIASERRIIRKAQRYAASELL